jgi:DNA-binding PadR family transcriptional regulator
MPLHHAVLALLAVRPAHGYELKTEFEQAVGEQWGGLNIGHLYQILDRLARDGLIETERQPQRVKPDRLVHRLTPAGRAELDRWLSEPSIRPRGYRDDFFLKVKAGTMTRASPVVSLLITAAELHIRADLEVIDAAETTLRPGGPPAQPATGPETAPGTEAATAQAG